ncbi:MAG: molybdate ABC transporter permease subunit [Solirubrobacterales bacterium]|nr:molybdate ABC transporter permease subunit [Solirubrobacterales bacterium]
MGIPGALTNDGWRSGDLSTRQTRPPAALALPAVLAVLFLVLPLVAVLLKLPWGSLGEILTRSDTVQALGLSLGTAAIATVICILLGVPLAWWLDWLGRSPRSLAYRLARALVLVPLVLPPVVGGVALLMLLGRKGVIGGPVSDLTGFSLPFTTPAVVIAQAFVALPFLVLTVEGALRSINRNLDEVALDLGATPAQAFLLVVLPIVRPAVFAGAVLCFARALGEFGATITFAGNLPGVTRTMPIATYTTMQSDPEAALTLSLILLVVAVVILVAMRDRWTRGAFG